MTRAKKKLLLTIGCCVDAFAGGLLMGEFAKHHQPILAAITVIVTFGFGICMILLMDEYIQDR